MSSGVPVGKLEGGEMPKDRAEVQDQYKIGGGSLNEFEFDRSKGEMEGQEHHAPEGGYEEGLHGADEPQAPQNVAERIRQVEQRAHEIVERRRAKASGGAGKSAKKPAGKAAAKSSKKAAKKAASGKGSKSAASKKSASKSAGKKSGGAKKAAASKASKKGGAVKKVASKKGSSKKGAVKKGSTKKGGRGR
jgi:hypothetical protein